MEDSHKSGIIFRFRRPSGIPNWQPNRDLSEALRQLDESEEMRPFIAKAHAQSRDVAVEVFHSREGHPLLVHVAATPIRSAPRS